MKSKHNEGFSLVEILIAIVLLAALVIPTCSSLVMAFQMNAKSDALMRSQLAVSSAVETLMAKGVTAFCSENLLEDASWEGMDTEKYAGVQKTEKFQDVYFILEEKDGYCGVRVISRDLEVEVSTFVRGSLPQGGAS